MAVGSEFEILRAIQKAAVAAVQQEDLSETYYGEVTSIGDKGVVKKVRIDEKWTLKNTDKMIQALVPQRFKQRKIKKIIVKGDLIERVRDLMDLHDIEYELDVDPETGEELPRDTSIFDVKIRDYLQKGDKVIMQREQGGQKFTIVDRSKGAEDEE